MFAMHLLYADESGSIRNPDQAYFVLAGVAVFERTGHWIEQEINHCLRQFSPLDPYQIELHGAPMRFGSDGWELHPFRARIQAQIDILRQCVLNRHPRDVRLFGAVVRKDAVAGQDAAEIAFEQICSRFDHYLARLYRLEHFHSWYAPYPQWRKKARAFRGVIAAMARAMAGSS
jgi:hypothetical protein